MNWLDWVIIIWLALSLVSGLRMGFIYKVGSLAGLLVGIWVASRFVANSMASAEAIGIFRIVGTFLVVLAVVRFGFSCAAWLVNKIFHLVAIIPGLKSFNRLLGGVLSVVVSVFMISVILFITNTAAQNLILNKANLLDKIGVVERAEKVSREISKSSLSSSLLKLSVFYQPLISSRLDHALQQFNQTEQKVEVIDDAVQKVQELELN